jgi:hypothetical protein
MRRTLVRSPDAKLRMDPAGELVPRQEESGEMDEVEDTVSLALAPGV